MGVDGLALSMVALTALLTPLCVLCSWHSVHDRVRAFMSALLFLESAMIGVFAARTSSSSTSSGRRCSSRWRC